MPKSVTSTRPSSESRMFAGFTSRCTMPARWAQSSAAATSAPMWTTSHGVEPSPFVEVVAQGPTPHQLHDDAPRRRPRGRCRRWRRWRGGRGGRRRRPRGGTGCAARGRRSGGAWRILTATGRSSTSSVAAHTSAMPPLARWRSRRYRPASTRPVPGRAESLTSALPGVASRQVAHADHARPAVGADHRADLPDADGLAWVAGGDHVEEDVDVGGLAVQDARAARPSARRRACRASTRGPAGGCAACRPPRPRRRRCGSVGFTDSIEPSSALALPMRPPFLRLSSVSSAP